MSEHGHPASEAEDIPRHLSIGFWWTTGAVALVALSHVLPEIIGPSRFVGPTGQVGGDESIGVAGALVAAGLLYGSRVARWITIAYLGLTLFSVQEILTLPGFRETGWLMVVTLNGGALGILAFVPAVNRYFTNDRTSNTESAA
jgi:hypothetical protein